MLKVRRGGPEGRATPLRCSGSASRTGYAAGVKIAEMKLLNDSMPLIPAPHTKLYVAESPADTSNTRTLENDPFG